METPTNSTNPNHNGTTKDQTKPKADQNNPKAEKTNNNRDQYLDTLYDKGGFVLACKTVVTLHRVAMTTDKGPQWQTVDHGVLAILCKRDKLVLIVTDIHSASVLHEFELRPTTSRYAVLKPHFHSFVVATGDVYGLGFVEVSVADKVSCVLGQLMEGGGDDETSEPHAKRAKLDADKYSDWVIINSEDVPPISGVNEPPREVEEGEEEETDFSLFPRKHDKKESFKVDEISGPSYFRHLTRTTDESANEPSSKGAESKEGDGGGKEPQTGTFERGTKRSSSFMELEINPAPTKDQSSTSTSTSELTTSGSFASSFSGSSISIPDPPDHTEDEESLLAQINTFDRKNLHHVTPHEMEEVKTNREQSNITSVFLRGFEQFLPKLQMIHRVPTVASINSEGEEEGFDEFDGTVFE